MTKAQHTPGPFFRIGNGTETGRIAICRNDEGKPLFNGGTNHKFVGQAYTKADADLFTAAPDLLKVSELAERILAEYVETSEVPDMCAFAECLAEMRAAIAKATGEEPHETDCPAIDGFGCRCGENTTN